MDDDRTTFELRTALKQFHQNPTLIQCSGADQEFLNAEDNPQSLTNPQINRVLDSILDSLNNGPEAITRSSILDSIQFLLKNFLTIPPLATGKLIDIIVCGLSTEVDLANQDIENNEQVTLPGHRELLEIYGFLLQWAVFGLEQREASEKESSGISASTGRKGKGKSKPNSNRNWDSTGQLKATLEVMCKVLKLKLLRIFVTTSERETFVNLYTKPAYLILESEKWVKNTEIRMHVFKVICIAVKHHGHAFGAQTSIVQNLTYFEHLSEPMAEFLQILSEQYDYPQLVDEILRELSNKEFNSNDTKGPKSISGFLVSLSERTPRLVLKQMTLVVKFLECESHSLRNAVLEACGNLMADLSKEDERGETHKAHINEFFDLLEERFLDTNHYCRSKAIQVYYSKILDLPIKYPKRRQRVAELALRSLKDKSNHVRKNAVKLLSKLISTHPYGVLHGGTLKLSEWTERLQKLDEEINVLVPPIDEIANQSMHNQTTDPELLDDVTDDENEKSGNRTETTSNLSIQPPSEEVAKLQLTRRYYVEAIRFIETIHNSSEIATQLLSAKNKSEVIEAMDFFKILDVYKIETAKMGIRRMLRLIWTKSNNDEGKAVQTHLIETYKELFFVAPDRFTENESANFIARNMISLTFGTSAAELSCLEQLVSKMMAESLVPENVIQKLWQIYGVQKREISKSQRRGAIIVLGMLGLAKPDILIAELDTILRVGLGPLGRSDLGLARYTCLALRHISPNTRKTNEKRGLKGKLPNDHTVLTRLAGLVELETDSKDWYSMAEHAISAIYALSKNPDDLCSHIIRQKMCAVFEPRGQPDPPAEDAEDHIMQDAEPVASPDFVQKPSYFPLTQLLFIVGHVAIKQIVHLEMLELEFKRRKGEMEKEKEGEGETISTAEQDELALIGGTTEDDFTDLIQDVRERELLYGKNSLLRSFGPLVSEICANYSIYCDQNLHSQATLCMSKLMCVSPTYCEEHLPLLLHIMERSTDPITRSNVVIALGDMAVCFNHLIDENTDFLYHRLRDNETSVRRTCLMTLTFLILAGQIKVKGQLGEMAKCVEDPDKRIADLARMFFSELSTKDNAVYNHFMDMFSLLSTDDDLDEESLKKILKFLASFIEKDKHAKQLADKLASRLPRCETEIQWSEVAYALSLLPHKNEEIQKTIAAGFRLIQADG